MRVSRERKRLGSRRKLLLVGGIAFAAVALGAGWRASDLGDGQGKQLLVGGAMLAICSAILFRAWWHRTPYDVAIRVPRRLSRRCKVAWGERPFLGWTEGWFGESRWAMGTEEDSVGVVGPPRVNKTRGIGIAQALMWGGPLVCISQTPILFRATAETRRQLAEQYGGRVMIYAPTEEGQVEGLEPIEFSPCSTDPNEVTLRVESWTAAAHTAGGVTDAEHWKTGAGFLVRGLLFAAAHHRVRPGDFTLVYGWLAAGLSRDDNARSGALAEPIEILRGLRTWAGDQWALDLEAVDGAADKERASFFSAARTTIKATANPAVLRSTTGTGFEAEQFLLSRSTLYVVSPTEHQRSVAPLIAMLTESLIHAAYKLHREGRLPARLGVSLDDLANIAPLPGLESHISQGGGQGVTVMWSLQSLSQLAVHYGREAAAAIWSATRCRLIFGGLTDEESTQRVSEVLPEEKVRTEGESETEKGRKRSIHESWRPLLSPAQLREIPDRWSLLIYHNLPPRMLHQPVAAGRWQLSGRMLPWRAAEPALAAAPMPAQPEEATA